MVAAPLVSPSVLADIAADLYREPTAAAFSARVSGLLADWASAHPTADDSERVRRVAERMADCCRGGLARVPLLRPDEAIWHPLHCDGDLCDHGSCHRHRTRYTRRRGGAILATYPARPTRAADRLRLLTLGLPPAGTGESPRDAYRRTAAALLRLRKRTAWRYRMGRSGGGLAAYEATWTATGWHGHWHILQAGGRFWRSSCRVCTRHDLHECEACRGVERKRRGRQWSGRARAWRRTCGERCSGGAWGGRPADHPPRHNCPRCRCLSCEWRQCTQGAAWVVDARRVEGPDAALAEVIKYVTKSPTLPADQVVAWVRTMKGTRRFRWLGSWYDRGRDIDADPLAVVRISAAALHHWASSPDWHSVEVKLRAGELDPATLEHLQVDGELGPDHRAVQAVVDQQWSETAYRAVTRRLLRARDGPRAPPPDDVLPW